VEETVSSTCSFILNMNPKYVIAYPFGGRPVPVDWHLAVRSLKIPTNCRVTEIFRRARLDL